MGKYVYVTLALIMLIALSLRLYPTLISGQPFSTDAWSPIRNAELLMEHTPIRLDDAMFDGYNNYWPANSLFGVVFSQMTGLEPKQAMALVFPAIGAMAILVFYALVKRLCNAKISLIASIIFATAFTHVLLTAAVTKETYANPLYLLLILIFLHPMGRRRQALLFTVTSIALALTHHLTPLITIAILSCITMAHFISSVKKGLSPNKYDFLLVAILTAVTALYYLFYAQAGFKIPLTLSDWLSAASYQLVAFTLALYFTFKPSSHARVRTLFTCSVAVALPLLFMVLAMKTPLVPGAPVLPSRYLLYAAPFIMASPMIVLGYGEMKNLRGEHHAATVFWFSAILGLEGYAIFGNSDFGLILAPRGVNFLWPPLAVLCAVGLYRLYTTARESRNRRLVASLASMATILTVVTIASLNSYSVYAAVSLEERYMGYFWLYTNHEYEAGAWITATSNNQTVAGDVKVFHLLNGYFNVKVDVLKGLRYLTEDGSKPQILFIYDQMLRNGYVLYSGCSVDLPEGWTEKAYNLNLIYSSGTATIYAG